MIIVKRFDNSKKALDYFLAFKVNNGAIKSYRKEKFFVATPQNLKELYLEKNTDNYLKFFKEFYQ
jgi:DNA-directed RNA polymerase specialized sigma subunit